MMKMRGVRHASMVRTSYRYPKEAALLKNPAGMCTVEVVDGASDLHTT